MLNDFPISPHFKLKEFACPCCQRVKLSSQLLDALEALRVKIGAAIIIHSGYRCASHNWQVGGEEKSYHLQGLAVDIAVKGHSPEKLAELGEKLGFSGIGIYQNFVHLDLRKGKARW